MISINVRPSNLLNGKSGDDILPEFTRFYKTVFQPNTVNADSKHNVEVDAILTHRMQHQSEAIYNIDINDILYNISKLKKRKTAGIDGILNEHIMFGGCHLAVHLCLLFNGILKHAYVPRAFCHGIYYSPVKNQTW